MIQLRILRKLAFATLLGSSSLLLPGDTQGASARGCWNVYDSVCVDGCGALISHLNGSWCDHFEICTSGGWTLWACHDGNVGTCQGGPPPCCGSGC
jgi:hypothetical protein